MKYESQADAVGHFLLKKYTGADYPKNPRSSVPTFHNSIEIIVVVRGEFDVYINGAWHSFGGGSVVYIDKLVPHLTSASDSVDDLEAYALVITLPYLSLPTKNGDMTFDAILPHNREAFSELSEFIAWGYEHFKEMNTEMKSGFAALVLGIMKKHYQMHKKESQRQTKLLFKVLEYINRHYSEMITLDELARSFGYEKTYLSKIFNSLLGMYLREYLNRYRIAMVNMERKQSAETSLWEIAERCGFESPNTFYRAYKKYSE